MFKHDDLPTLHRMQAAAIRIREMIHRRAVAEYYLAFGNANPAPTAHLDMCVIHNSLVGREAERPWLEVNYDHMRRAAWLCEQSLRPARLVTAWYDRKSREAVS